VVEFVVMPTAGRSQQSLAVLLDRLFRTSRADGRAWTNDQVAKELKRRNPGLRVTGGYLSALRNGGKSHPSIELQQGLADFFGVPLTYFAGAAVDADIAEQAAAIALVQQAGVRAVALRAIGVHEESLAAIAAVLDNIRALQGLPPVEEIYGSVTRDSK
jgi:transcriptional regulator with XRE-family HTH domain